MSERVAGQTGSDPSLPNQTMTGVRILEVASWTFVPAAGAVLADWGADVIKVEHPESGDPQRGLITSGLVASGPGSVNFMIEFPNRGKRSIGLDIAHPDGHELLMRLAETSDVFLTNFMPPARQKLKIDVEHLRARNPNIIYARGSGQGTKGPDVAKGGYDGATYWARASVAASLTPAEREWPIGQTAAFGDLQGAMTIAGGISAALFHRERTGEAKVVDISLLGVGMWAMQPGIVAAGLYGLSRMGAGDRYEAPNPIVGMYKTKDDRVLSLVMLESDRFFGDLVTKLGRPELATDPRFVDAAARSEHRRACVMALEEIFASRTLAEWRPVMETVKGVWAVVQNSLEVHDDAMVIANGYLPEVTRPDADPFKLVAAPVQFNETPTGSLPPAPDHGEHTDQILTELGLSMEDIISHKVSGAIL